LLVHGLLTEAENFSDRLLVLYHLNLNTYRYGEHMENIDRNRKQMKCGYPSYSIRRETKMKP